jgi:BirA family biotin operon repressor/biotin-[acetyl-CoA-carboxylase] ligase
MATAPGGPSVPAGSAGPPIRTVPETGSTQQDLLAVVDDAAAWPHLSGLRALRQRAGRGRGDRVWDTSAVTALTASLVLRPLEIGLSRERWSWLSLVTGLAVVRALRRHEVPAALKWPNDVVVPADQWQDGWGRWRKVAGVLAQVSGDAVVVGVGVNLDGEPPVPWASTVAAARAGVAAAELLEQVQEELGALCEDRWGWPDAVADRCVTLGQQVAVQLPGGETMRGEAVGLDGSGGLLVRGPGGPDARVRPVHAGDVEHCRTTAVQDR